MLESKIGHATKVFRAFTTIVTEAILHIGKKIGK
jgi:hypothetical protein